MTDTNGKRKSRAMRPLEDRVAEIDHKIAWHTKAIEGLQAKKAKITAPRKRRSSYANVFRAIKESGLTPEEVMARLNG